MNKKCTVLDKLLTENWFTDKKEAEAWVMMRNVLVNEIPVKSLSQKIPCDSVIRVKEYYKRQYVNKGGLKLQKAIETFIIDAKDKVALDCGASTGGFTDCWLHNGASKVYAVDVGFGQLAAKLIQDSRVVNMEKTNLADEKLTELDPKPDLISLDLSYLSLKKALPLCQRILKEKGIMICLIKPIFETESHEIRQSGDINQKEIIKPILLDMCDFFLKEGLNILGLTNSPIRGNTGTLEYLICVYWNVENLANINNSYEDDVEKALEESFTLEQFKKNEWK